MSGAGVVAIWGAFNTVLAALLAGFTAAGLDGGAGHGGVLAFIIYAAASALIFDGKPNTRSGSWPTLISDRRHRSSEAPMGGRCS